jgi:hypothetical protein
MLPWDLYERFGDRQMLAEQYPAMKQYVDYLTKRSENHIVSWHLGDWLEVGAGSVANRTPVPLTSTMAYFRCARIVSDTAKLLGIRRTLMRMRSWRDRFEMRSTRSSLMRRTTVCQGQSKRKCHGAAVRHRSDERRDAVFKEFLRNIHEDRKDHISSGLVGRCSY